MKTEGKKLFIVLLFVLVGFQNLFAQNNEDYFSYKNRLAFGNHLFCEKDYLRAIGEYNWLQSNSWNDSIQFKIGIAYFKMQKFNEAFLGFGKIPNSSPIFFNSEIEKIRNLYFLEDYNNLHMRIVKLIENKNKLSQELKQLDYSVMLLNDTGVIEESTFLKPFDSPDKIKIKNFYDSKINPQYKSKTTAVILSSIIPGLGKIYADETSDGITSFLLTGLFTYLSVNKFQNDHTASGIIYASIATSFYAGNIYGSASAVQNYNVGLKILINNEIKMFINDRNQFLPTPKYLCD